MSSEKSDASVNCFVHAVTVGTTGHVFVIYTLYDNCNLFYCISFSIEQELKITSELITIVVSLATLLTHDH